MSNQPLTDREPVPLWKSAIDDPNVDDPNVDDPNNDSADHTADHNAQCEAEAEAALDEEQPADAPHDQDSTPESPAPDPSPVADENGSAPQNDPSGPAYHYTIHELPQDLRPRERLAYAGAGSLNNAELLAIILRTGGRGENVLRMSERVLMHFGGMKGMAQATFEELCSVHGMGKAKAAQIQSALEFGKRLLIAAPTELPRISTPIDIANMLMLEMGLLEQEELRVVLLDSRNHVLKITTVYRGSLNAAVVRIAEIFREAIRANSASLILVHNHPSGDPRPSPEDTHTTRLVVEAGALLDIEVLDHLIIGDRCFVSMKERGLGFS